MNRQHTSILRVEVSNTAHHAMARAVLQLNGICKLFLYTGQDIYVHQKACICKQ